MPVLCFGNEAPHPWRNDVYVWQRTWNAPVTEAVTAHASQFHQVVVLAGEVSWPSDQPQVIRVPINYPALTNYQVGLALRIGPYTGPFSATNHTTAFLTNLAADLIGKAKAHGVHPSELQIDFDCAASKLAGYRIWVEAIRRAIAPTPLIITTLPSWLDVDAFGPFIHASDGYVLQVHSLAAPKDAATPFTLCDPEAALRAVQKAGSFGVPFRVALPTYGYLVAFDAAGKFIGLSADGPQKNWPATTQIREVRTDPMAMAHLSQFLATNHPVALHGVIWYRLPVAVDNLNWRWPTLSAIVAAREPQEHFQAVARRIETGLVEISLVNNGELDISSRLAVEVRWTGARLIAGDGSRDFELTEPDASVARFQIQSSLYRLAAGETQVVGWLRFDQDREVQLEVKKF